MSNGKVKIDKETIQKIADEKLHFYYNKDNKVNIKQEHLVNLVEGKTKYYYNSSENTIVVETK